jgi:hypothetical protein
MERFRVGRKVGRTIYRQVGQEPSDADELVGVMDTRPLAAFAVAAMNGFAGLGAYREGYAKGRDDEATGADLPEWS